MIIELDTDELRRMMQARHMTVADLAESVGVSQMTVYRWLWGKTQPRTESFKKICETLDVKPWALMRDW